MKIDCSPEGILELRKVVQYCLHNNVRTKLGKNVPVVDLWKLIAPLLLTAQKQNGDAFSDSVLWSLQRFLTSSVPQSSLLFFDAVTSVIEGKDPNELNKGYRRATWQDVEDYLRNTLTKTEMQLLKEMISRGAIEGYEVLSTSGVLEPQFQNEPLKMLPFSIPNAWFRTSDVQEVIELPSARFVVADETVSDEEQVRFLQQLSRTGAPIVLICYRMDESLAEDLGRGWRDGWSKVVPYTAVDSQLSEEFRVNCLADTAWITGSSLCSYVTRTGLRDLHKGSREISAAFPVVSLGANGIKFLAHSSRGACKIRVSQILSRLDAPDESAELLLQRAAYINGVEVQLFLPEGSDVMISSLDLGVSVYKSFMNGVCVWDVGKNVPFEYALMAIEHARPLRDLFQAPNLELR
jgi:hypothetical protein